MAVRVTKETQPRVVLKGANSGTVNSGVLSGSGDGVRVSMTFTATAEPLIVIPYGNVAEAQLEAGSFPTSYIPTSGSQQTRSADVASIPVSAFGYNQDAGTVVVEVDSVDDGANTGIVSLDDGTTSNMMSIQHSQTPKSYFVIRSGNVAQASPELSTWLAGERTLALSYKENDFAFTEDGAAVTPVNSATVPSITTLNIGKFASNVNSFGAGLCHIKSLKYYPRRLTNTQLQELTS